MLLVFFLMTIGLAAYFIDRADRRAFNATTPAQRLQIEAVKRAARQEVEEANRAAQLAVQARKIAAERRQAAIRELQDSLKNLGYDLTVTQSDKRDEVVITSKDFDDSDHRVRFLAFLRGRNSPAEEMCLAGFQTVRLKGGLLFGFSEAYSLECLSWR